VLLSVESLSILDYTGNASVPDFGGEHMAFYCRTSALPASLTRGFQLEDIRELDVAFTGSTKASSHGGASLRDNSNVSSRNGLAHVYLLRDHAIQGNFTGRVIYGSRCSTN
jgi:hypothetical protein